MCARPSNPEKKLKKLAAPATQAEIDEFRAACAKLEVEPADMLRKLARALVKQAEEHGHITQPIRFSPQGKQR